MNRFALALVLLAVAGRTVYAEDKAEAIPVAPQPTLPVVAVPQAAPLFMAPTDDLPTFVGAYGAPVPTPVGAPVPHPVQQVAAQSPVAPKLALLREKQAELLKLQEEVRQLRAEAHAASHVLVTVQVVEFSLTKMQTLGVDLSPDSSGYFSGNDLSRMLTTTGPNGRQSFMPPSAKPDSNDTSRVVDWILDNGIGKILADPKVAVMEGRLARFHSGGEIPLPAKDGSKVIEYQPFGTQVDMLATSLGDDRVRLELKVRISDVDSANTLEVNGIKCPRLNVQAIETGIESAFGESTLLTGMVEKRTETIRAASGVQGVANLVRGKSGTREVTNEICTMLVVTPERIEPLANQQPTAQAVPK